VRAVVVAEQELQIRSLEPRRTPEQAVEPVRHGLAVQVGRGRRQPGLVLVDRPGLPADREQMGLEAGLQAILLILGQVVAAEPQPHRQTGLLVRRLIGQFL
jgi:hypothetical protein